MHVSDTARNGNTKGNQVGTGSKGASSAIPTPEETKSSANGKSAAPAEITENLAERVISVLDERERLIHTMDMSFGVEKLTYKKMWKTLKTVVKEIGNIKEANEDRFALGVTKRLDNVPTLMEFRSFDDYLSSEMKNFNEDSWVAHGTALAHDIAEDAVLLKNTLGDISPHRVVFLLSETK